MIDERFAARFDGSVVWKELSAEQQSEIGSIALEVVVNWNGMDAYEDRASARPFVAGDSLLLDALHAAVAEGIAPTLARDVLPVPSRVGQVCRRCGCTEHDACPEICAWSEPDLCTSCAGNKHAAPCPLLLDALKFASLAHADQKRKYTGEDYIHHPLAVAQLVDRTGERKEVVAAAFLHDVVEDCDVTLEEIETRFGKTIADLVEQVTNVSLPEDGNRAERKALDRQHLAAASPEGKTIKLADIIDNTKTIAVHDPEFAKVYMPEKRLQMPLLIGGDPTLWAKADAQIKAYELNESLN